MLRRYRRHPARTALIRVFGLTTVLLGLMPQTSLAIQATFSNHSPITINDNAKAAPYPSSITVSGIAAKTATHVTVNLRFLSHPFPDDVDILLVGPTGAKTILMSDAAGRLFPAVGAQITFDGEAPEAIPFSDTLFIPEVERTYRPANYPGGGQTDVFPTPGPGSLLAQEADLAVFDGLDPNGEWKLYVIDDAASGSGMIENGWDLVFTHPDSRIVNTIDDVDDGVCNAVHCSLREAINTATPANETVITFASPLFDSPQTITLAYSGTLHPLLITQFVTIRGPGARLLTISGAGKQPVLAVESAYPAPVDVRLSGLSITGGKYDSHVLTGGGISNGNANLTISDCHIFDNVGALGGGILSKGSLTLERTTLSGNLSLLGGSAIMKSESPSTQLQIRSSTISGNVGLSIIDTTSPTTVEASTIFSEFTPSVTALSVNGDATAVVTNTIIAGSQPSHVFLSGSHITSGGHNLISHSGSAAIFNQPSDINAAPDSYLDPRLAPLAYYGGGTPTHAFASFDGPAVDRGLATGTDQRGAPRVFVNPNVLPAVSSNGADIGAFEQQATWTVTNTGDAGGSSCLAACSLRQAITAAASNDSIFFAPSFDTPKTIVLGGSQLSIDKNLFIDGPGASRLTVSANGSSRVFEIAESASAVLHGMTITGGVSNGIHSEGTLTLSACHVTENSGANGGGIRNDSGLLTVLKSTIAKNTTTGTFSGGGITSLGQLVLETSTVSGNQATAALANGGGVLTTAARISSSTISNNTAAGTGSAGGLHTDLDSVFLRNSIIADNSASLPDVVALVSDIISGGYNLIGNRGAVVFGAKDQAGTMAAPIDPRLQPLADNGGPTPTHVPQFFSPAVDRGSSLAATDQRGLARTFDNPELADGSDGASDVGAVELQSGPVVTRADDSNDGKCDASCSLREAIAQAQPDEVIRFHDIIGRAPMRLTLGELVIDKNLLVFGRDLTVSGNHQSRVFHVASGATVTLNNLTIADGDTAADGGGILNDGSLTLSDCYVVGNRAAGGGGIFNSIGADLALRNTTVANNTATGSDATGGGIASLQDLSVVNSTISGNRVLQADHSGGGIWLFAPGAARLTGITNSTITGNSAPGANSAGGIRREAFGTFAVGNSIIAGNQNNAVVPDVSATNNTGINSSGFNLIGNRGTIPFPRTTDQTGTGNARLDPGLGPLQLNGGATPTHALLLTSPALDKGKFVTAASDQRHLGRPFDAPEIPSATDGDGSDIGAVEMRPVIVANASSEGMGSLSFVFNSAPPDADILFDPQVFGVPHTLSFGGTYYPFFSNDSVRIFGPGANLLTISGNKDSAVFSLGGPDVTLSGLRITTAAGLPDTACLDPESSEVCRRRAGAIQAFGTRLTLSGCEVVGNTGYLAGAIFAGGGTQLTLQDSLVANNTVAPGFDPGGEFLHSKAGGIFLGDGSLTVLNSTISGNTVTEVDSGGGISAAPGTGTVTVLNSTITGNQASGTVIAGGIRHASDGVLTIRNSIVAANGAAPDIFSDSSPATLVQSGGYNLVGNRGTLAFNGPGDHSGTFAAPLNPLLGPLASNGAATRTHALLAGSSALDAGGFSRSFNDQRRLPRPVDNFSIANASGGDGTDIGAYESQDAGPVQPTATATAIPATPAPTPGGDCCAAHGGPGCDSGACQSCVCAKDVACCGVDMGQWDALCAAAAAAECNGSCLCVATPVPTATPSPAPTPGGDCCAAHDGVGCDHLVCMGCVCNFRPDCCANQWDETCAAIAMECEAGAGADCGCFATAIPTNTATPPAATPTMASPTATQRPPTPTFAAPTATLAPPTATTTPVAPATATLHPPTATLAAATATLGPPTPTTTPVAPATATPVSTPTPTATGSRTPTSTGTPTVAPTPSCFGDLDGSGEVTVDEIITAVNLSLHAGSVGVDPDSDGEITLDEILQSLMNALTGCV